MNASMKMDLTHSEVLEVGTEYGDIGDIFAIVFGIAMHRFVQSCSNFLNQHDVTMDRLHRSMVPPYQIILTYAG